MTAYPPEWVIYDEIDYESFHLAPGADEGMGMAVLAKVDLEGHLTSQFKCLVFGAGPSIIRIPATRIPHHRITSRTSYWRCPSTLWS